MSSETCGQLDNYLFITLFHKPCLNLHQVLLMSPCPISFPYLSFCFQCLSSVVWIHCLAIHSKCSSSSPNSMSFPEKDKWVISWTHLPRQQANLCGLSLPTISNTSFCVYRTRESCPHCQTHQIVLQTHLGSIIHSRLLNGWKNYTMYSS